MPLEHPALADMLRKAYSVERAAALAYIGHAKSVSDADEKAAIRQIEQDEWDHRREVLQIMEAHGVSISRYYEFKFSLIGNFLALSCRLIGWFMPFYFAGRLESGNVCEYFRMLHYFDELGITAHHEILFEMGVKEKEHEIYFLEKLQRHPLLPLFERVFSWGNRKRLNDVDVDAEFSVELANARCKMQKQQAGKGES